MKKTLNGTILGVLLVWSLYFFFVTRDIMSEAVSGGGKTTGQIAPFFIAGAILLFIIFLMIRNSTSDKNPGSLADRLRANTTLSEQDEREERIASEVAKKGYITISNFIILFMMVLPMFGSGKTFTVNQVLVTIAIAVTLESLLFFYRYYKMYNE